MDRTAKRVKLVKAICTGCKDLTTDCGADLFCEHSLLIHGERYDGPFWRKWAPIIFADCPRLTPLARAIAAAGVDATA